MAVQDHPAYPEEKDRLEYTLGYVEKSFEETSNRKVKLEDEIDKAKKHFSSDSSQSYIDLLINTTLQDSITLKLKNLITARSKPYFARIDFKEENKEQREKLYIGKMCLVRDEDQEVIIVDWRAPIANLYYESRLGTASYLCPQGQVGGELLLKRQYSIEEGMLNGIFDIDITTNDAFLQSSLGANADNRLKDIVSTIQSEQNDIIRADMWTPLIVQGAAGSGKTTIALHRIAYLIYTYEKSFQPENFMIIAPNRLFLNYISDVLPELGVERVKQTTFEDFALEIIGKKSKVRDANEKLTAFVDHNNTEEQAKRNNLVKQMSSFKASMTFKEVLDEYITMIENSFIPKEDFKIDTLVVFRYAEINQLFLSEYKRLPMIKRVDEIKKHLNSRLKLKKTSIISYIENKCYKKIDRLKLEMEDSEERQQLIIHEIDQKDHMIKKIEAYAKKAVNEYIAKISKINVIDYYLSFFEKTDLYEELLKKKIDDSELIAFIKRYSTDILKSGFLEIEDFAPIIYIKYCIYGMDEKIPVRHIVIDEAQDFSVFQFHVLSKIIKDSSYTILGDLCQGIHSYRGTNNWEDVRKYAFQQGKSQYLTLEQSYRTTVEIMDAANSVIKRLNDPNLILAKPVIRHGEKVHLSKKQNVREIAQDIADKIRAEKIRQAKQEGFQSIAVVCKTMEECKQFHTHLKKMKVQAEVINGNEKEYKSGLVIVPSYLAKGLEFDIVMIANASAEQYKQEELDIKLLYVAMTRPLHRLCIYYAGEISSLLENIEKENR